MVASLAVAGDAKRFSRSPVIGRFLTSVCVGFNLTIGACGRVETIVQCPAPGGQQVAVVYVVYSGGGATGSAWQRVAILRVGERLDPENYVFEDRHGGDVRLEWHGDHQLVIGFPDINELVAKIHYPERAHDVAIRTTQHRSRYDAAFLDPSIKGCWTFPAE
jgi:hypothetical protein